MQHLDDDDFQFQRQVEQLQARHREQQLRHKQLERSARQLVLERAEATADLKQSERPPTLEELELERLRRENKRLKLALKQLLFYSQDSGRRSSEDLA